MDILFVVMPFADVGRPAIGVSLLKAAAIRAGYSVAMEYCNLALAERIGVELYQKISNSLPPELLTGEWFFADDVFGEEIPAEDDYLGEILLRFATPEMLAALRQARKVRAGYLAECAARIAAHRPRLVGFTTTFHQTCASLALARRLKSLADPPAIVFGGANCEGEMGLQMLQSFPWIDYICSGEADVSFPKLLQRLWGGVHEAIPGVLSRIDGAPPTKAELVRDMDALPIPDYDDYFTQIETTQGGRAQAMHVVVETSRGCWWGAKHHCTFCGLNGDTMAFRSKSPARAFAEIDGLTRRHGLNKVGCVDNILDMNYVATLFPQLAASGLQLELFYEVKSNLRYDQLLTLRNGGMRQIQPGIESFSDQVLQLMDKGVTGLQNIQLLRWSEELGIDCAWNLLAGFPGEDVAEYQRMAAFMPLLVHLNPPCSCAPVRLDRFSPFHTRAEQFGFRRLRPARAYFFVFPLGRRELMRLAYFFDFDYGDARTPETYMEPVRAAVDQWWRGRAAGAARPRLDARFVGAAITIEDTRPAARAPSFELTGVTARVLMQCDSAATVASLLRHPELADGETAVRAALEALMEDRLVLQDDRRYVALPVFRDRPAELATRTTRAYASAA